MKMKFFWINLFIMTIVVIVILIGVLKGLDSYTRHGEAVEVPDVKDMSVTEAERIFRNRGLDCVISDSNYVKTRPAGCILDYNPSAGGKVKEGRTIYLTVNTRNIPLRNVPDVADNSSLRQAEARILASGFKLDSVKYVPGERDWVYGVRYGDRELAQGEQAPEGAVLTLVVGNGGEMPADSLQSDSLHSLSGDADSSWF